MNRLFSTIVVVSSISAGAISVVACSSSGEIAVGRSDQQLQKQKNGGATGNGQTCSWEGTVASEQATTASGPAATTTYNVGDTFKSLDACNDCSCAAAGILCTQKACDAGSSPPAVACTAEAKQCSDGSYVSRTGPNCEFAPCPSGNNVDCTQEAKQCPDGSYVSRTGPNCEFAPCPGGNDVACTQEAKQCPDGTYVSRTGPNCEFAPCP